MRPRAGDPGGRATKPRIRCFFGAEDCIVHNLGDVLVPHILDGLGYAHAPRHADDASVVNPGRCLVVIGSLLTRRDVSWIGWPLDVWGCGWKGPRLAPGDDQDLRYFAVRGPLTAAGLRLPADVALGDPALLLPHLVPLTISSHGRTVVVPHIDRVRSRRPRHRCAETGCDETLVTWVWTPSWRQALPRLRVKSNLAMLVRQRMFLGVRVRDLWSTIERIAGARFVLTGSLHAAILAQAYGVPWAAYDDGFVDAPPKWLDWAAYLGVSIEFVRTLAEGQAWWQARGRHGRLRSLGPLLDAFPVPILNPAVRAWADDLRARGPAR
jgi:hypothetical protein